MTLSSQGVPERLLQLSRLSLLAILFHNPVDSAMLQRAPVGAARQHEEPLMQPSRIDGNKKQRSFGVVIVLLAGAVLTIGLGAQTAASAAAIGDTVNAGQQLVVGQSLGSTDGRYTAVMQGDGNFVVYGPGGAGWNTGGSSADHIVMQGDGNLVSYNGGGGYTWSSGTATSRNDRLVMQSDGNLVIYSGNNIALWSNGRVLQGGDTLATNQQLTVGQALYSTDGRYGSVMQGDGNFVVYGPGGAGWNTGGSSANHIVMQGDGNLVSYNAGGAYTWSSGTSPTSNDRLVMQSDGNLVIYSGSNVALWSNGQLQNSGGVDPSAPSCTSFAYACTPNYNGSNASSSWAWAYYGGSNAWTPNGYHNCTLYAAYRLRNPGRNWGNAVDWANSIGGGNRTASVGAIAWYGATSTNKFGHVAYVEAVDGGNVFLRADNYSLSAGYTTSGWVTAASVGLFLHP